MQMRDMKTIFNYMTIMALLLTFTGCEEEEVMTFGEERGVNFVIYEAAYGTYKDDYKNLETEYNFFKEYANNTTMELPPYQVSIGVQLEGEFSDKPLKVKVKAEPVEGYEQLAVELTAILAQHVEDSNVKMALEFALLEDFDHVFRFANLLEMDEGIQGETLLGGYTEIMPGRPTIAEHRYPADEIKKHIRSKQADLFTKLTAHIITAAEQQTMNFYMNQANFYPTELGRKLYAEIAMIEEQHVSQYGSLLDTNCSWLEGLVMHEYTECYLYYGCYEDESDKEIKALWKQLYLEECGHLQKAAELLEKYEGKSWQQMFTDGGAFPKRLRFGENKDYVRKVLEETGEYTAKLESYDKVSNMPKDAPFFTYNSAVNKPVGSVASHEVIQKHIEKFGQDYRYEEKENPIQELRDRKKDNTDFAR